MEDERTDALVQIKQEPLDIVDTNDDALYDDKSVNYVNNDYDNGVVFKQEATGDEATEEKTFNETIAQDVVQEDAFPLFVVAKEKFNQCAPTANDTLEVVDEREDFITVNAAEYQRRPADLLNPACSAEMRSRRGRMRKINCDLCRKCFSSSLFAEHNKLHLRNFIFCQMRACYKYFNTFEDCELHEYQQHNVQHNKCNVCNHKFLCFNSMREHKEKMHGKLKRIVCSVCREWFINDDELHEHWVALPLSCGRLLQLRERNVNNVGGKVTYALQHVKPVTKIPIQKLRIKRRVMLTELIKNSTDLHNTEETTDVDEAYRSKKRARLSLPTKIIPTTPIKNKSFHEVVIVRSKKRAPEMLARSTKDNIHNSVTLRNAKQVSRMLIEETPALYNKSKALNEIESRKSGEQAAVLPNTSKESFVYIKEETLDAEETREYDKEGTVLPITEKIPVVAIKEETLDAVESHEYGKADTVLHLTETTPVVAIKEEPLDDDAACKQAPTVAVNGNLSTILIKKEPLDDICDNPTITTNQTSTMQRTEQTPIVSIKQEPLEDYPNDQQIYNVTQNTPFVRIKPKEETIDNDSNAAGISTVPTKLSIVTSKGATLTPKESLSSELARRITSKFALKAVPKVVKISPQAKVVHSMPITPTISTPPTQPLKMRDSNVTTILTPGASKCNASKILKLSPNMKIVKFSPETQPHLLNAVTPTTTAGLPTSLSNGNVTTVDDKSNANSSVLTLGAENSDSITIEFTTIKGQKLFGNRNFTLKKIELPNSDANEIASSASTAMDYHATESVASDELLTDATDIEEVNELDSPNSMQILENGGIPTIFDVKEELDNSREVYGHETPESLSAKLESKQPAKRHLSKAAAKREMFGTLVCYKCHRRCSSRAVMRDHINSDCGRKPPHECKVCHKSFFSASTLNCHRSIHTGELPHKCDYCDKRFRTRGQVTVHHRTHTGERPFVCEVCMQGFTHRETLIAHLTRHIGMKRYKCYGCSKQFSCISGLSMHRANRPYTCGKVELNTRAIGPRVRVIRGQVVFEPQPEVDSDDPEVLTEIQNK